jgi:fatty acid-binding protein DegV
MNGSKDCVDLKKKQFMSELYQSKLIFKTSWTPSGIWISYTKQIEGSKGLNFRPAGYPGSLGNPSEIF